MTQRSRGARVVRTGMRIVLLPLVLIGAIVALGRRRRPAAGPGPGETGGGTAGDREPRNPLPTTLVDAGAGIATD